MYCVVAVVRVKDAPLDPVILERSSLNHRPSPHQLKVMAVKGVGFEPTYLPPMSGCSPMSYPLVSYLALKVLATLAWHEIVGLTGFEPVTTKAKLGSSTFELTARVIGRSRGVLSAPTPSCSAGPFT